MQVPHQAAFLAPVIACRPLTKRPLHSITASSNKVKLATDTMPVTDVLMPVCSYSACERMAAPATGTVPSLPERVTPVT